MRQPAGGTRLAQHPALHDGPLVVYDVALSDGTTLKVTTSRGAGVMPHAPGDVVRVALAPGALVSVFAE